MPYRNVSDVLKRVQDVTEFLGVPIKSVDQHGIFGNTPLSVVVSWPDVEAARILLDAGANVDELIEDSRTALHDAAAFGAVEIVELLLQRGASREIRDREGRTPADIAQSLGLRDVVLALNQDSAIS